MVEFDKEKGIAKLRVENPIDIWHLEKIIEKGDLITAKTLRTIFVQRGEERIKGRKKFLVLTIKIEKVEFQEQTNKLRLIGKIVEAPEEVQKGSYHSIEVGTGKMLTIEKGEWKKEQMERLEKTRTRIEFLKDSKEIEEFFVHVNRSDGLAVYGFEQVKMAASIGAIKIVFIPEEKMRSKENEELIDEVANKRGEIRIVSKRHPVGEKFCKMYDIAAILRFPIS